MARFHCITSIVLSGANFPPPDIVEPIHKIATHGVKFWKESDDTVFKLPKEKCIQWLVEHRAEVIRKLNANFSKLWFGWKKGWVGCRGFGRYDLWGGDPENGPSNVCGERRQMDQFKSQKFNWWLVDGWGLRRGLQVWTGMDQRPWCYSHLCLLIFLTPSSKSFLQSIQHWQCSSLLPKTRHFSFQSHSPVASSFHPYSRCQLWGLVQEGIYSLVVSYLSILTFLLFRTLFGKQTSRPFSIRILRVCILQDPVAAKHSKIKDKTIKDLLGNINFSLINKLLEHVYGSDTSKIPTINYLGPHCHSWLA